jgi:hypothetical protein
MKIIIMVIAILASIPCFSQNLENLDIKYGFNKFKLGSSYQNYSRDLTFLFDDSKTGVKYYKYTKKDISVFGFSNVKEINLLFYRDKLYTIDINLYPSSNDEIFSTIASKLKELFGYPTTISSGRDYGEWDSRTYMENVNQWLSSKTLLGLSEFKCSSPTNPCVINIFLVSKVIQRQITNDGF